MTKFCTNENCQWGGHADGDKCPRCGCRAETAPEKWIVDLHDTRAGMKLNPEWLKRRPTHGGYPEAAPVSAAPIPMVLYCPACGLQHIDAPETCEDEGCDHYGTPHGHLGDWDNPPHRSHLCAGCGHIWRPADVPTVGVEAIQTKGKNDSPKPEVAP